MPIYEFRCDVCGRKEDLIRKFADATEPEPCAKAPDAEARADAPDAVVSKCWVEFYLDPNRSASATYHFDDETAKERDAFVDGYLSACSDYGITVTTKTRHPEPEPAAGSCKGTMRRTGEIERGHATKHFWQP